MAFGERFIACHTKSWRHSFNVHPLDVSMTDDKTVRHLGFYGVGWGLLRTYGLYKRIDKGWLMLYIFT